MAEVWIITHLLRLKKEVRKDTCPYIDSYLNIEFKIIKKPIYELRIKN